GLPLVSTRNALHSPEIAYVRDGENGFLTDDTPEAYAEAVLRILSDPAFGRAVAENALAASRIYTLENMVDRFMDGLRTCLAL
ncbi:MAG TPA: hypothetical protein VEB64_17535, partial [Azospirillaceae bacterium]|nr:hypothetical protein [Azospirillaceae bacterium]